MRLTCRRTSWPEEVVHRTGGMLPSLAVESETCQGEVVKSNQIGPTLNSLDF